MIDKCILEELYIQKKMPMHKIAKKLNVSIGAVHKYIHRYDIEARKWKDEFTMKGRKLSREQCEKISKLNKGKKLTQEQKMKISNARKLKNKHGHKKKRNDGYITVYYPDHPEATKDGYVLEHRLIMSKILNRNLLKTEVVHHINGVRHDNRPENLMIFSSIKDHRYYHVFLKKASDI